MKKKNKVNILLKANEIINERGEEKERMYGPMLETMQRAADLASQMTGKDITNRDIHLCMVAMKLAREAYHHKEDNLLDAIAYIASLNNLENENI